MSTTLPSTSSSSRGAQERIPFEKLYELYGSKITHYCKREKDGPRGFYLKHIELEDMAQEVWYWISRFYDHPGTVRIKFSVPLEQVQGLQEFLAAIPTIEATNGHREHGQYLELTGVILTPRRDRSLPPLASGTRKMLSERVEGEKAIELAKRMFGEAAQVSLTQHRYDPGGAGLRNWILRVVKSVSDRHAKSITRKKREGYHEIERERTCPLCSREHSKNRERCAGCGAVLPPVEEGRGASYRVYSLDDTELPLWIRKKCEAVAKEEDEQRPELELESKSAKKLVAAAMRGLPAQYRAVLEHVYEDGLSIPRIAELYDWLEMDRVDAVATVRRLYLRAMELMKGEVEKLRFEHRKKLTLSELPTKERAIMEHRVIDGLDDEEIAELYDWLGLEPEAAVKVVRRIRTRAQKLLNENKEETRPQISEDTLTQDLPLDTGTISALIRGGLKTAREILEIPEVDLQALPGIGHRRFAQIRFLLIDSGIGRK